MGVVDWIKDGGGGGGGGGGWGEALNLESLLRNILIAKELF